MTAAESPYSQHAYAIRFDWGAVGARALAADVSVVVDVLSFSTSVCVAVERGMRVYPYRWKDSRAQDFAREHSALLVVGRIEATKSGAIPDPSLSPASLLLCEPVSQIVLPSPNGSTIAAVLHESGSQVAAGCLRNADAIARWLTPQLDQGKSVAIIAAGERWDANDSLRVALEDQLGAGAILSALVSLGHQDVMSPEASATAALFDATQDKLSEHFEGCVGACELNNWGFHADVDIAGALNSSDVVPVLTDGAFTQA